MGVGGRECVNENGILKDSSMRREETEIGETLDTRPNVARVSVFE